MTDCANDTLIPLSRAVSAAVVDTFEQIGAVEQVYSHWGAREIKKLQRQVLKMGKRYATLAVNRNTFTATLPADFNTEFFIGYLDESGRKIGLPIRTEISNSKVVDIPCDDSCPRCNQSQSICADLQVTESIEYTILNGNQYEITVIKKLYDNGNYYLEKSVPYYNTITDTVEYAIIKDFITNFDLKDCGCLEPTEENIERVRCYCADVYNSYYNECSSVCNQSNGGYRIFSEQGFIQLDRKFAAEKLYIEYQGFLPKVNGQLAIPEVAFETVVAGIKVKAIEGKTNVAVSQKQFAIDRYRTAYGDMIKEKGRISIDGILQAAALMPKFDINYDRFDICNFTSSVTVNATVSEECAAVSAACSTASTKKSLQPFQLIGIVNGEEGSPEQDSYTWNHPDLIGATSVGFVIVNKNLETNIDSDYTFNSERGEIIRTNPFQTGDTIIIPYAKYI